MKLSRYFPIDKGIYEVSAGMKPLGADFGNGELDQKAFQIEADFLKFRTNKMECRKERLSKYLAQRNLLPEVEARVVMGIAQRLSREWPEHFLLDTQGGRNVLTSRLTQETFYFSDRGELLNYQGPLDPLPQSMWDGLALLVPEDLAVLIRRPEGEWLSALHLCSPSHWAAEDKIGLSFFDIHKPVPGIDRLLTVSDKMVEAMIERGPYVRFVWSFVTDERLNHHPVPPPGADPKMWKGRTFDLSQENPFFLRVERQVTQGFADVDAALFSIKVSFWSGLEIRADSQKRHQLTSALKSMTPASRVYKGVDQCFDDLVQWLTSK